MALLERLKSWKHWWTKHFATIGREDGVWYISYHAVTHTKELSVGIRTGTVFEAEFYQGFYCVISHRVVFASKRLRDLLKIKSARVFSIPKSSANTRIDGWKTDVSFKANSNIFVFRDFMRDSSHGAAGIIIETIDIFHKYGTPITHTGELGYITLGFSAIQDSVYYRLTFDGFVAD